MTVSSKWFSGRLLGLSALVLIASSQVSQAALVMLQVTVENVAPPNGVALTPVWVGFHSGNFDSYNATQAAGPAVTGLERLAEDGNTGVLSSDFGNGLTYVNSSGVHEVVTATGSTAGRVDGTILSPAGTPPPFTPGQSASMTFTVDDGGANNFFSYASMILPSNDFFVANGNPTGIDISSVLSGGGPLSFNIGQAGTVNDAGTEEENFATSAANGLFGLTGGQTGPNQGAIDPQNFVRNVTSNDPFAGFANIPAGDLSGFNFNNTTLYPNGIARITISAVPEPSSAMLLVFGAAATVVRRRRNA